MPGDRSDRSWLDKYGFNAPVMVAESTARVADDTGMMED